MITNGFTFVAFLVLLAGIIVIVEKKSNSKIFNYIPGVVMLYFFAMLLATFGLWEKTDSVNTYYKGVKDNLLPAMIFLMLLRCDLRKIFKLGPKMLIGFFSASISIGVGFVVSYAIFKGFFPADTWKSFAALAGSWMGGTGNMAAIQGALNVPDSAMGYTLLIDSIDYSIWVMILLALVPFGHLFNKWTKADTKVIDEIGRELEKDKENMRTTIEFSDMIILLGSSLMVSSLSQALSVHLPQSDFLTVGTWTVIIATVIGVLCALTPFGKLPGSSQISNVMLYIIIGLIASRANFAELTQAPIYIVAGFVILIVHAVVLAIIAKIFKLDLFTCGVASLANIGGVASAPILAASYSEALIPIGVLMAMLGYVVGTGGGLFVGKILSML
ncbi:conserved membrane protein of unknown function [Acetoanaerobium sticklandii]|uniref:DUF819 domain-containing protein n=1 Tax=Acetoanaerobium sticklandii (strain ATCC 12662 / DSM 519 / JCM 1433 / CCUG 9281 / NCIMB 10654 / HF) TaxID=499177 RepID=E3PU97_ACESD|nr:DUF819 family protein [Acetoanaerobium sticklandii]CBH20358.1 conserved membrane protein of unknown function [Acetoanaerobium sticklandii]